MERPSTELSGLVTLPIKILGSLKIILDKMSNNFINNNRSKRRLIELKERVSANTNKLD